MMLRASAFTLCLALLPSVAQAQEATPTAPAEPVPLFQAACISGAVRLTKSIAEATPFAALPAAAQRALGASTVATRGEAEKLPAPTAAQAPNIIYRIAGGQLYLVPPTAQPSHTPIGDSCIVLWHALSDEDYFAARRLVLPNEETVPLTARPTASAVGASVATSAGDSVRMTAAAYGGWVVLRSSSLTESKAPGAQ
ncbi:hypothetical protein J2W22_001150 [Sphingomonas kyeonggiensis]|uniref:hypothetical protein n=1 Tax=Sphingomonas kyeonggiensis TaxID=1268553 RepID=UPI0027883629|nr:hypothetical protein [Sphingomonas kyeonggiensis]MDQ0249103.1 hypothetical protein [Sphingomonas kyeonggiensis]